MFNDSSLLTLFDPVDELTNQFEDGAIKRAVVDTPSLGLGALAELLVLRRDWRKAGFDLQLKGGGDARHAVISQVVKQPTATTALNASVGARSVFGGDAPGQDDTFVFIATAGRLAREGGMPADAARLMQGAFGELIDNISKHAGEGARGIAAFEAGLKAISLVVADTGQGIVRGYLEKQPELQGLGATDALEWAVRQHRSRFTEPGHGTGFQSVLKAMRTMDASLRVRSDEGSLETEGQAGEAPWLVKDQSMLNGFVVSLRLTWA